MFCEVRLRTAMCDIYCLSFDFYDFRSSPVSQLSCKFLSDLLHLTFLCIPVLPNTTVLAEDESRSHHSRFGGDPGEDREI